jgi:hypothetical protein
MRHHCTGGLIKSILKSHQPAPLGAVSVKIAGLPVPTQKKWLPVARSDTVSAVREGGVPVKPPTRK